jgi:hypothetical protein
MINPTLGRTHRALTIVDVTVGVASATALAAVVGATAASMRTSSNEAISMANLMQLGVSQALYAWDHDGLQWCGHSSDFGLSGNNCGVYLNSVACPEQMILGWDQSGGLWGYWLGGGMCPPSYPGNCGNWSVYVPNTWESSTILTGAWHLIQARSFHNYVNGRFYDPVYYAPNDRLAYRRASPWFDYPNEFTYNVYDSLTLSSYGMSPAAMWHPDVYRAPSAGGFRAPSTFPESFERQSLFAAMHADLKSLMFEMHWNQGGRLPPTSAFTSGEFLYNQSADSKPISLFYDGHVWFLPNAIAIADDDSLVNRGLDGLWSRDTPLGADGFYGAQSVDGTRTSHSVLTTGGIHGRDVLKAR